MSKYVVYTHIFPNGKRYVGITGQRLNDRFRRNGNGYVGQFVHNAIIKYGWHNVEHRILYENLTLSEAEDLEKKIISEWKTNDRKYGYNVVDGGLVNIPTEASKMKNRLAHIGKNVGVDNPFYGKKHSVDVKRTLGRKVRCINSGVIYQTLQEAQDDTGVQKANIYKVCRGLRKSAGDMEWCYES